MYGRRVAIAVVLCAACGDNLTSAITPSEPAGATVEPGSPGVHHVPDTTPPVILGMAPGPGATRISDVGATVTVGFSERIKCELVDATTLRVFDAAGAPIAGTVTCDFDRVTFSPAAALPTRTRLSAELAPDLIYDLLGNRLVAGATWQFDMGPWTRVFGTGSNDVARAVATDAAGNVFVAGWTLGPLAAPSGGDWDGWIAKLAPDGGMLWRRALATAASDDFWSATTDAAGNLYVAGNSGSDGIVEKLDTDGNELWQTTLPGGPAAATGVTAVRWTPGHVYVAGSLGGAMTVADLDEAGAVQWSHAFPGIAGAWPYGIAVDGNGNIDVAGGLFDSTTPGWFALQLDATGSERWSDVPVYPSSLAYGVAVDASNALYLVGYGAGVVVEKLDSAGAVQWTRELGAASSNDVGEAISIAPSGGALFSGYHGSGVFLGEIAPDGTLQWLHEVDAGDSAGWGLALDSHGHAFIAGQSVSTFDGVGGQGGFDALVVEYDQDGTLR